VPAAAACADRFERLEHVGVTFAELAPAVLAGVDGRVGATRKRSANLTCSNSRPNHTSPTPRGLDGAPVRGTRSTGWKPGAGAGAIAGGVGRGLAPVVQLEHLHAVRLVGNDRHPLSQGRDADAVGAAGDFDRPGDAPAGE